MNTMCRTDKPQQCVENERSFTAPGVDIIETKDNYLLKADMPGVDKTGLEVLLDKNELTIVGRRSSGPTEASYVYRESRPRDYRRVFELDPAIDSARISAQVEHGVLTLVLPKAEHVKPKRIAVTG